MQLETRKCKACGSMEPFYNLMRGKNLCKPCAKKQRKKTEIEKLRENQSLIDSDNFSWASKHGRRMHATRRVI